MITKLLANDRKFYDHDWLKTYHLFSFADYYDPNNIHFGALRVFNDDTIDGHQGFGAHSHSNMEIVTLVFEGQLTHQDSIGNTGKIAAGDVQYMSAGTGVTHAEMNNDPETVHLYQIWILPRQENLKPKYDQKNFGDVSNSLVAVASGFGHDSAIAIEAPAVIFKAHFDEGKKIEHELKPNQGLFVYVTSGEITINNETFGAGDQARITDESQISIKAKSETKFVVIETSLA